MHQNQMDEFTMQSGIDTTYIILYLHKSYLLGTGTGTTIGSKDERMTNSILTYVYT